MATTADVSLRIDADLRDVGAELDFLPEAAKTWVERSEDSKVSYYLEWDELSGRLGGLHQARRRGEMTGDQQVRYGALLEKLDKAQALLERLDLQVPEVPAP